MYFNNSLGEQKILPRDLLRKINADRGPKHVTSTYQNVPLTTSHTTFRSSSTFQKSQQHTYRGDDKQSIPGPGTSTFLLQQKVSQRLLVGSSSVSGLLPADMTQVMSDRRLHTKQRAFFTTQSSTGYNNIVSSVNQEKKEGHPAYPISLLAEILQPDQGKQQVQVSSQPSSWRKEWKMSPRSTGSRDKFYRHTNPPDTVAEQAQTVKQVPGSVQMMSSVQQNKQLSLGGLSVGGSTLV